MLDTYGKAVLLQNHEERMRAIEGNRRRKTAATPPPQPSGSAHPGDEFA